MVNNWGYFFCAHFIGDPASSRMSALSGHSEKRCKDTHKTPFLLVNFTTCYYLSRFSFRHNLSHSLLAQIELLSNHYI